MPKFVTHVTVILGEGQAQSCSTRETELVNLRLESKLSMKTTPNP